MQWIKENIIKIILFFLMWLLENFKLQRGLRNISMGEGADLTYLGDPDIYDACTASERQYSTVVKSMGSGLNCRRSPIRAGT